MRRNRISVGFHRLGIALAILPTVAALAVLSTGAYQWGRPLVKPPIFRVSHETTGKSIDVVYGTDPEVIGKKMKEVFGPATVPDDVISSVDGGLINIDRERQYGLNLMAIGAGLAALGLVVYATSWLMGWIIRGFLGNSSA